MVVLVRFSFAVFDRVSGFLCDIKKIEILDT